MSSDPKGRVRRTATIVGVLLLAFVGLLVALVAVSGDDATAQSRLLGRQAPVVSGTSLGGDFVTSQDFDGWLVLNFFALWCPGCIREHPELVKLEQWGAENNLEILAVVFDSTNFDDIAAFFDDNGGDWPVINSATVASDYAVARIPETFLISPDNSVVERFQGEITAKEIQERVAAYEAG